MSASTPDESQRRREEAGGRDLAARMHVLGLEVLVTQPEDGLRVLNLPAKCRGGSEGGGLRRLCGGIRRRSDSFPAAAAERASRSFARIGVGASRQTYG